MADDDDQPRGDFLNHIRVGHLPYEITAKEITRFFEPFGTVKNLYLKRRTSRNSNIYLPNPYVFLVFDQPESIDQIMAARPLVMGDCELFVRRCMPITPKYRHEALITVNKILIRTRSEKNDEILPDDKSIVDYLTFTGGKIDYFERLDNKTVLVQFDDYDPVDVCCLLRPHFIQNQPVEIEKCCDEEQVRRRVEFQQKSNSLSPQFSPASPTIDTDSRTMDTVSPTPILSIDDQLTQLHSTHNDMTSRFEREHEQLLTTLSNEWKQTAKERIRLQRLTLDYQQEHERLTKENRKWKKFYSDSLKEKPDVQTECEHHFKEACQKYDQLIQNIPHNK